MKFTRDEKRLIALKELADFTDDREIRKACMSLILWFQRHGSWTPKQGRLIDSYVR